MSLSKIIGEVKNFVGELFLWLFILLPLTIAIIVIANFFSISLNLSQVIRSDFRYFILIPVCIALISMSYLYIVAKILIPIVIKYLINEKSYFSYIFYDPSKFPDFTEWKKKHEQLLIVRLNSQENWQKRIQSLEQIFHNIRQRFQR